MRNPALLLLLFAAAASAALVGSQRRARSEPERVSGVVEADETRPASRTGGRVLRVPVEEGAAVEAGAVLLELDPFDLREQRARAEALRAGKEANLAKLRAGSRPAEITRSRARRDAAAAELARLENGSRPSEIAAARAGADLAQAENELARAGAARAERLAKEGAASVESLDQARTRRRAAEATLAMRNEELALLREGPRAEEIAAARARLAEADQDLALAVEGPRAEDIAEAEAALAAAAAEVAALDRRLEELILRAPSACRVEALDLRPGDVLAPNAPAMSLLDLSRLYIRAYIPRNRAGIRAGDELIAAVDAFPGERFRVRVSFVAREAEFTPSNEQTPEERSKRVFRVKADFLEGADRLRPGMTADLWLDAP